VNSSNQCEKSNDMIASNRCKHKDMSWTYSGLSGMRSIQVISINEEKEWYEKRKLSFRPAPLSPALKSLHEAYGA